MKRIATYIILTIALMAATSCLHNNGDIGPWFGQWKVTRLLVNSETDPDYRYNTFWSFQSTVMNITEIYSEVNYSRSWGTWSTEGNKLILNYDHSDKNGDTESLYTPQPSMHLNKTITVLDVVKLSGSEIILKRVTDDGTEFTYYLKKWG